MRKLSALFVFVPWLVVLIFVPSRSVSAQQMPDPKQMSGMPLPVPDVAVGTVSARVIRGALTNPMQGETVELLGAGDARTATTDEAGRATFSGIAPGTRVKTVVTVKGERIESQEFAVPAAGGIRVMLVATDADIEKRAAEDRALAAGPAIEGAVVFGDQSRFVIEIGDDALNVFNMMQIVNTAKRPVSAAALVFELPAEAIGVGILEGSSPSAVAAGKKVTVNGPFAPGDTMVQFAYSIPLGNETVVIAQKLPAQMTQMSVIAQKIGGMQLNSPQLTEKREMPADGQTFLVGQGGSVKAGDTVTLTLSGLPHRSSAPAMVTLVLSGLILAAGAWGASRSRTPQQDKTRAQLQARRDKLFAELTQLEEQRRKGTVDVRVYATRREHLVTALEDLYAGLEREVA
jgi:hypothetical protein